MLADVSGSDYLITMDQAREAGVFSAGVRSVEKRPFSDSDWTIMVYWRSLELPETMIRWNLGAQGLRSSSDWFFCSDNIDVDELAEQFLNKYPFVASALEGSVAFFANIISIPQSEVLARVVASVSDEGDAYGVFVTLSSPELVEIDQQLEVEDRMLDEWYASLDRDIRLMFSFTVDDIG